MLFAYEGGYRSWSANNSKDRPESLFHNWAPVFRVDSWAVTRTSWATAITVSVQHDRTSRVLSTSRTVSTFDLYVNAGRRGHDEGNPNARQVGGDARGQGVGDVRLFSRRRFDCERQNQDRSGAGCETARAASLDDAGNLVEGQEPTSATAVAATAASIDMGRLPSGQRHRRVVMPRARQGAMPL